MVLPEGSDLYSVKVAAVTKIADKYGLGDKAKRLGNFLFREHHAPPVEGNWNNVKRFFGHSVPEFAREWTLGSPLTLKDQLVKARAEQGSWGKAVGQHAKKYYWDKESPLGTAFGLTMGPGMQTYQALTDPNKENRPGNIARVATSAALTPFTSRLGIPGMMLDSAVADAVGTGVNRLVNGRPVPLNPPPVMPLPEPVNHPLTNKMRDYAAKPEVRHALNAFKAQQSQE